MISVLYVDDESLLLDLCKLYLERMDNVIVDTAESASTALEKIKLTNYDVIVSDYLMPGMDGITFLKILRDAGVNIPFIIFTGRGREEVVIQAFENGADFYIQKGGDPKPQFAELERKIKWAVERRRTEDQLRAAYEQMAASEEELKVQYEALAESESRMRASEERYKAVVEDQTEFISRFLPDGTHIFVNEAYCRYFGLPRDKIVGHRFKPSVPDEDRDRLQQFFLSLSPGQAVDSIDHRIIMPDGTIRWLRWSDRAIFDSFGSVIEYQSVGRDITRQKQAEEALRESENKYRTVFENTGTAMVVIEENSIISLANEEFASLCGFPREEIEWKKSWTEFVVREDLERMLTQHQLRREDRDQALTHYEFRFAPKAGDIRNIYLTIDVIPGTKKSVASLLDITDRKRVELALKEREAQVSAILHGSPIPNFVIDRNHRVISWNRALEESTGIKAQDVLGTKDHWRAFYSAERRCLVDFLLDDESESLCELYGEGVKKSAIVEGGYEVVGFFPHVGKSGRWLRIVATPILDENRSVIGGVETLEDVTPIKEVEQSLRKSEQRYLNIIEDQTEFVCRFLPDGTHVFVNDAYARYFGKTRDEMRCKIFRPQIHPDDREMVRRLFTSLTPEHPVDSIEQRIVMSDGELRWQRWSDRAIFDKNGTLIEYQSVGRDITSQKKAEEALYEVNRHLKILTGVTRHDIRNKITIILGYIPLMKEKSTDPEMLRYLEILDSATRDIQDQIAFTRIYQDLGGQKPQWQKLNDLIARLKLPKSVTLTLQEKPIWIYADPMLEKVFLNLLDNSIRHGMHVTAIRIFSRESDEGLTVIWEDNGVGIPMEEKTQVFKRGYGRNTGLGLFLVREILAITKVTVIENGVPGTGARFEISVPRGDYRISQEL